MQGLRRRAEFRAVAKGVRINRPGFVLQAARSDPSLRLPARFGYTVTRRTGSAVVRNRIRRRLREAVRLAGDRAESGTDYVLIGRIAALTLPFDRLVADVESGFRDISARRAGS